MLLSIHSAFVPTALQMIGTTRSLVDAAEQWCADQGKDQAEVIGARLAKDMLPFTYQVASVGSHTAGAIAGVRAGVFSPDLSTPPSNFDGLRAKLDKARGVLETLSADEMDGWIGQDMRFEFKELRLNFTAENFLLSFSQPNYFFHATTAYDILRMLGVSIGKKDFMGAMRIKAG